MSSSDAKELDVVLCEHATKAEHGVPGLNKHDFVHAQHAAVSNGEPRSLVFRRNFRCLLVVIAVQTQSIVMGLEGQFINSLVGNQAFCRVMGTYDASTDTYAIAAWVLSLWAGIYGIGQIIGQLFTAWVADRWGRRVSLYFTLCCVYIGVAAEMASQSHNDYTGAKLIMGFASGGLQAAVSTFVSEVAPRELRGFFIGMSAFELSLGGLIGSLVLYGANQAYPSASNNLGWRVPLSIGLAAPTVSLVLQLFLLPESPSWLVVHSRKDDARKSIARLHPRLSEDELDEQVNLLIYTIEREKHIAIENEPSTFWDCFKGVDLRRTFVSLFPQVANNLTGNQLIGSYTTYFFELAGVTSALRSNVIVTCLGLGGTVVAFFLVDSERVGRWMLVMIGMVSASLCMLGVALIDTGTHGNITASAGTGIIFLIALFNFTASMGPGVAGLTYVGESSSLRLRTKTAAIALALNVFVGTVCNTVLPYLIDDIQTQSGYVFFGFGAICTTIIALWIPDLTGRTYAEIDELFVTKVPSRKFDKTACTGGS